MFLALLAVIYIANGHWADNTIREINITQRQVKDMEYEYKNLKSLEMYRSRESQVMQAAAAMGLKPAAEPPVKLGGKKMKIEKPAYMIEGVHKLSLWRLRKTYYGAFTCALLPWQ